MHGNNSEIYTVGWIGLCIVLRPCQHSIGYMGDGFYRSKEGRDARPERRWGCRRGTPCTLWVIKNCTLVGFAIAQSSQGVVCQFFACSYLNEFVTRSQAVARIADRAAKNCRGHVT